LDNEYWISPVSILNADASAENILGFNIRLCPSEQNDVASLKSESFLFLEFCPGFGMGLVLELS
jgi:hypothetical protein